MTDYDPHRLPPMSAPAECEKEMKRRAEVVERSSRIAIVSIVVAIYLALLVGLWVALS